MGQVGKVIYNILSTDADTLAIVGNKIYPIFAPQGTLAPLITYYLDDVQTFETKDSYSNLLREDWRLNLFSNSYEEVSDLFTSVKTALDRFTGDNSGVCVSNIVYKDCNDLFDREERLYQKNVLFNIMINL